MRLIKKISDITPEEIMTFLCEEVMPSPVNSILYFAENDIGDKSAVLTAYLLKFAESAGLPVIAYLQDDKSGLTQVGKNMKLNIAH